MALRSALLCHHDSPLDRDLLARWLASWSDLVGIIEVRESGAPFLRRVQRERRRSGWFGLLDVMAFRAYYRLLRARKDEAWLATTLASSLQALPPLSPMVPVLRTPDPNSREARDLLAGWKPDLAIARVKRLLRPEIYRIPAHGVYVLHPGICPQYRNAHGCFWAMARKDFDNVGATLLQIDQGIDTGPVYAYLRVPFDPSRDSHVVVQHRAVFENLPLVRATLEAICAGRAKPLDTMGKESGIWGHPRLSAHLWQPGV
ncbi:MAG: formyltransferase family protein [Steroidobacteraceae bacterium]